MKTDKDIQPNNTDTGVPVTCNLPKANATCNLQLAAGDNKRILILDGATGTALQKFGLTEADFRGEEFAGHPIPLKGNNDVLNITRPDVIRRVHQS